MTLVDALAAALAAHKVTLRRVGETPRGRPTYRDDFVAQATSIAADPAFRAALAAALAGADFEVHEDHRHGERWADLPGDRYREWWLDHARQVVDCLLPAEEAPE